MYPHQALPERLAGRKRAVDASAAVARSPSPACRQPRTGPHRPVTPTRGGARGHFPGAQAPWTLSPPRPPTSQEQSSSSNRPSAPASPEHTRSRGPRAGVHAPPGPQPHTVDRKASQPRRPPGHRGKPGPAPGGRLSSNDPGSRVPGAALADPRAQACPCPRTQPGVSPPRPTPCRSAPPLPACGPRLPQATPPTGPLPPLVTPPPAGPASCGPHLLTGHTSQRATPPIRPHLSGHTSSPIHRHPHPDLQGGPSSRSPVPPPFSDCAGRSPPNGCAAPSSSASPAHTARSPPARTSRGGPPSTARLRGQFYLKCECGLGRGS